MHCRPREAMIDALGDERGGSATASGPSRRNGRLCTPPAWPKTRSIPYESCGVKSSVDDLALGRGVVLSRAATTLRSIETKPFD